MTATDPSEGARVQFSSLLKEAVSSIEGATGAMVLESDGEAVEWHPRADADRLRLRGAYMALAFERARAASENLGQGKRLLSLILEYEGAILIIAHLDQDYSLALELEPEASIGQAFYRIQPAIRKLRRELAT
jgi:predicted regulator of Ras-like GTPase activity (Roadblock/LC7/MglB family)